MRIALFNKGLTFEKKFSGLSALLFQHKTHNKEQASKAMTKNNYTHYILSFIFILIQLFTKAESTTDIPPNWAVKLNYQNGALYAHHKEMKPLIEERTQAFSLELIRTMSGKKAWHQNYNLPQIGIGFSTESLSNPSTFGQAYASYFIYNQNIVSHKQWHINYQLGIGLAYISQKYDSIENPLNRAIGSHINAFLQAGFLVNYEINSQLSADLGVVVQHYSNGKTQSPNWGLNLLNYRLGLSYYLSRKDKSTGPSFVTDKHQFSIVAASGYNENKTPNRGKFLSSSLSISYETRIGKVNSLGLGLDYTYDGILYDDAQKLNEVHPFRKSIRSGLHIGYTQHFGDIGFIIQIGNYLSERISTKNMYHKMGLRFKINRFLLANLSLKTHWGTAHCIEYGLGYYFNK